jgi:hypothetical protein
MAQPVSGPNSAKPTTGATVAGVYNATPPVLEDGQACPIQVDINGQIKTSGSGGTQDVNITEILGAAPSTANPLPVELSDGTNPFGTNANPLSTQTSFSAAEAASVIFATWDSSTAQNTAITANLSGFGNCGFSFIKTGSISIGVISFEISPDGTNWLPLEVVPLGSNPTFLSTYSLTGASNAWQMFIGGFKQVRIRLSTAITGSGTAKVCVHPSVSGAEFAQLVFQPTGSNLHVAVDSMPALGAGNQIIGQIKLVDGAGSTNLAAVKAASTAAAATDPSLVVAASPNSPIPARAATTVPTAVSDGAAVPVQADKFGHPVAVLNAPRDLIGTSIVSNNSATSGASLIGAGASNVYNDIITLIITNRSATATVVSLTDGTNTYTFAIAANGGLVCNFPTPLPAASSATAWTIGNSAAVACDYVTVFCKNK